MDKIILGLLMMKRFTAYEIRGIIAKNFMAMCSDSMGAIQAAIKKLLAAELIVFTEIVENSVYKKRYSITDKGRKAFSEWIKTPADLTNSKNMELGKLLFMGFAPADTRPRLIEEMIDKLEEEYTYLLNIQDSVSHAGKSNAVEYWKNDSEYFDGIQSVTQNANMIENTEDIWFFQVAALEHGIDNMKFNIKWLKRLQERMKEKEES